MEKYQPGKHEQTAYVIQAAHIQEGEYFSRRVHDDIDGIMEDIREGNRGRSESAPDMTIAEEFKRDLDEVANFKGSRLEQLILLFCKQTRLRYIQEFESMEHFKEELIDYIDYYNNRRIKARLKGLPPALHRQQALLAV